MNTNKSPKAAIYIRVSTLDQARDGFSLPAQRRVLEEWCDRNRHSVYKVYGDEGISGKDMTHRPAVTELISDAKSEKFDTVLVWALSRFTRSVADLYNTWNIFQCHNISLVSVTEGFDTNTPTGRAMMGMLGVFAQMEWEITSERVALAMQERAAQGKRTCNYALGYDSDGKDTLAVNDREADLVRLIFRKFNSYKCLLAVSDSLNLMGFTGRNKHRFTAESVKRILTNPLYIGYYSFKGERYKGDFEPIIDTETWNRAQNILKRNRKERLTSRA